MSKPAGSTCTTLHFGDGSLRIKSRSPGEIKSNRKKNESSTLQSLVSLIPASVVKGYLVIQLDEHKRDGRVAQRPRQVADMTGGIQLRALVLAQGGVARPHLDPMSVHRLDEPAPRQRDDPLRAGFSCHCPTHPFGN